MTKYLWIPVAGTVAALVAIFLAHSPREGDEAALPVRTRSFEEPPPPSVPGPEYTLQLRKDGLFVDGEKAYASAEEVIEALAPEGGPRPTIILENASEDVPEEALDAAIKKLSGRCDVEKRYGDPGEEPPEEDE